MLDGAYGRLVAAWRAARGSVVVLTGAGMSTPSGIPDFRSRQTGLWARYDPMEVASLSGFRRDPARFYAWWGELAPTFQAARPNPAHVALSELEHAGHVSALVTQNIDGLHTAAGSDRVYELHGHVRTATCLTCGAGVAFEPIICAWLAGNAGDVPRCEDCAGVLKPNVVLFGEYLPFDILAAAEQAARSCRLMVVAGSALEVHPAAGLPAEALRVGAQLAIINYTPTVYDADAAVVIRADVAVVLPEIAARVCAASEDV